MHVSYSWLKRYCDFDLTPDQLARLLTDAGLEVEAVEKRGADTVLVTEVTTNRPDWLSHVGVARDVAALTGRPLVIPKVDLKTSGSDVAQLAKVDVLDTDLCPSYTARVITDVKVGPSPAWLVEALESLGLRSVNNVADITNFVLFECGQPLHAFDYDKLNEHRIVVRRAHAGEKITTIDAGVHELAADMLVIADARNPVAVAGVMGGLATEVTSSTRTVLLESARFEPVNIRRTSRRLGLPSDSSYRFERGIDPRGVVWASTRAAQLIAELAGGKVAPGLLDVSLPLPAQAVVSLRPSRFQRVMGIALEPRAIRQILLSLGLECLDETPERLTFRAPSWRPDITREADLIEEVARIHGLVNVPARSDVRLAVKGPDRFELIRAHVADVLTAAGYSETVTWSLMDLKSAEAFHPFGQASPVQIRNPLGQEAEYMRLSMIPSLLKVRKHNQDRRNHDVRLFEVAGVYLPASETAKPPQEKLVLALLSDDDFPGVKGAVEALASALRFHDRLAFVPGGPDFLQSGAVASITLDGKPLGYIGMLTDKALAAFDLKVQVVAAELDFAMLASSANLDPKYTPLPRFPEVTRDLAVIVDEAVPWTRIQDTVRTAAPDTLESVTFLSEFRGKQIPDGKKCIAFGMTFRAQDRTLTSEEADAVQQTILSALQTRLSATLRAK